MSRFRQALSRELKRRLPDKVENRWSYRIEGLIEQHYQTAPHEHVAVIVDSEVDAVEYEILSNLLYQFIQSDYYFKQSRYRILLWQENVFSMVSPRNLYYRKLKQHLSEIELHGAISGDWTTFFQLYEPHKKAGQAILITSKEKVEALKQVKADRIKNLVIIYYGGPGSQPREVISSIPCLALESMEG